MRITFYADRMKEDYGGMAYGPVVLIRPKYRDDGGLHAHEYLHVDQWYATTILSAMLIYAACSHFGWPLYFMAASVAVFALLYRFTGFGLWCEVQCYRKQLKYYADDRTKLFAGFLATKYRFSVTPERAEYLLRR